MKKNALIVLLVGLFPMLSMAKCVPSGSMENTVCVDSDGTVRTTYQHDDEFRTRNNLDQPRKNDPRGNPLGQSDDSVGFTIWTDEPDNDVELNLIPEHKKTAAKVNDPTRSVMLPAEKCDGYACSYP
ncbi:hypothetical protein [Photobacterium profundum]|uniref:hypothetical protein n=1 Tax=Photobacterium profundum TaxID=74109 RepID=UPI003D138173